LLAPIAVRSRFGDARSADCSGDHTNALSAASQDREMRILAKVLASIKIFPSDTSISLNALKEDVLKALPSSTSIYKFEEEPIAFGLVALVAHVLLPEEETGKMNDLEESLKSIKSVSEIQSIAVRRVSGK